MTSDTTIIRILLALVAVSGVGFAVAGADPSTVLSGTKLSTPLVILAVMALGVIVGVRRSRPAWAAIAALPCLASCTAILSDGDFAHAGLSAAEVALQALNAVLILALLAASAVRLRRGPVTAGTPG